MTELRRPSHKVQHGTPRPQIPKPNALNGGPVCDGCRWPDRCRTDDLCWQREKQDISHERKEQK